MKYLKKLVFVLFTISLITCNSAEEKADKELIEYLSNYSSVQYLYKIKNTENIEALDTAWKLIFYIPGIDQINVPKNDSILTVVFRPDSLTPEELIAAFENAGILIRESQFIAGREKLPDEITSP